MSNRAPCDQLGELLKCDPAGANREAVATHIASCPVCQQIIQATVGFHNLDTTAEQTWRVMDETAEYSSSTAGRKAGGAGTHEFLRLPGYEILGELGRGGMGVVFKARQISLDRVVALKIIGSAAVAGPNQLARFNTEAEALAQLQHPNIVQVFDIGQHQDMPYLSMEFVAGKNLASALESQRYSAREAAAMVEKLARAMFSAHQRGVLHRDLKPSNVLLAADGEPKITDFGLAKRVGSDSQLTVDQTVMGTPSYMPPEQAQGQVSAIGPRSDIYSLGAILYELLTGRPPFRGSTPLETIGQVIQQEPVAPRVLQPRIPRDVETICLKCLHKQPSQRYETAADLADDLRRFQGNEPILARRIGLVGRGWRWGRRNPALSAAILVICLAVLAGAGGVAWQSRRAKLATANAQQHAQRFRAESIEKLGLIQDLMERVPEDDRAQDERLQSALASYDEWLAEEPSDDTAKASYAEALFRVAEIRRRIGQLALAEEVYRKAQALYQQLTATAPNEPEHLHGLAETMNWLGECYREGGQLEEAIKAYEQAMQHQARLAVRSRSQPDPSLDAESARSLYNRALALRDLDRIPEAEKDLRRSIELLRKSLDVQPSTAPFRQGLARTHINLGMLLRGTQRPQEANNEYLAAIELLEDLEKRYPRSADYRLELATALMNRSNLLLADLQRKELGVADPLQEAEASYRASVEKLRLLAGQFANVSRYRKELANSLNGLGAVLSQRGRREQAEQTWREAANELRGLVARSPGVAEHWGLLAQTSHNLAFLHRGDSDTGQLESLLRDAVDGQRKASSLSPTNMLYVPNLRNYERNLSRVLADRGKHTDAAEVADQLAARSSDDAPMLYAAAKVLAQCAMAAERDADQDATRRAELANRYRTNAENLLVKCREQGLSIKPDDFPGMEVAASERGKSGL